MLNSEEFECGLGSCSLTAASRFVEAELLKHLEVSRLIISCSSSFFFQICRARSKIY